MNKQIWVGSPNSTTELYHILFKEYAAVDSQIANKKLCLYVYIYVYVCDI